MKLWPTAFAPPHPVAVTHSGMGMGMGMGLLICRSIIELHNGRIWAGPNWPHGVIFHFTVPSHQEDAL
jgi:signal transduction histidine kinase